MRVRSAGLVLAALGLAGCASMGPETIQRDRFDYAAAISDSWKSQMLLNLVKARYGDVPVFLDVASAINSYSIESGVSAGATLPRPLGAGSELYTLGATSRYTDRPTITYNPLLGDKFSKSLMTPIQPGALLALIQAGWSVESLLRCCVHTVNGLQNAGQRVMYSRPADPEFVELLQVLGRIQRAGGMGMRVVRDKATQTTTLFFRTRKSAAAPQDVAAAERMLGITVIAPEYTVVYGSGRKDDQEIAILTRSMLEILLDMSAYIDVPDAHVAEKRASPGFSETNKASGGLAPLIRVHSAPERPPDSYVAIRYREHWFWIDDRDLASKGMFSFLMFLFTLSETGGAGQLSPVITVPAG